ncbi:M23 family metallopeptidase [Kitasatospora sp. NPDC096147]|uniref:M23 family metallopeptidase n=1 Tax=Kitasatospora sp. NPDC096147 TaxID=3364093 RepID=UPI0037FD09ED
MASTHTPAHPRHDGSGSTQLLDHPLPPEAARHRMPRQSRGTGPLIGVTAMAASLGATGFAAAAPAAAAPAAPPAVAAADQPAEDGTPEDRAAAERPLSADPGLALAARIQQQADGQRTSAEETARLAAAQEAEDRRTAQARELAAAEAAAEAAAQAEAAAEAEAEKAERAGAFTLPTSGYHLTAHYGQSGSYWSHLHTGLDFAAATGTPVTAVSGGTVSSAGWSGAYGYRVIQTLPDGTEVWYCHLSSITVASGPVAPGTVLGKVGATGNVTGAHLHLEVRPGGATPVDPLTWLRGHGLNP